MLTRHDQDMDRRSGTDVSECNYRFVSINHIAFNVTFDNATEKTIAHQLPPRSFSSRSWMRTKTFPSSISMGTLWSAAPTHGPQIHSPVEGSKTAPWLAH